MKASKSAMRLVAVAAGALLTVGLLAGCTQSAEPASDAGTAPSEGASSALVNSVTDQEAVMFTLYVGMIDKDTGTQVLTKQEAKELATPLVSKVGGGYTVIEAEGGYTNDSGILMENDTLVYTGVHASEEEIRSLIDEVKEALNIESIYVTCTQTGYAIYGGQVK